MIDPDQDDVCLDCELADAAFAGDRVAIEAVIQAGADPASLSGCNTALDDAIRGDHLDVAALLLDSGADPNRSGSSGPLLAWTIENGRSAAAALLVASGAEPGELHLAQFVSPGDCPSTLAMAMESGVMSSQLEPRTSRTALHVAAMYGYTQSVALLLTAGLDPGATDAFGNTAIDLAKVNGHTESIRLLRESGA